MGRLPAVTAPFTGAGTLHTPTLYAVQVEGDGGPITVNVMPEAVKQQYNTTMVRERAARAHTPERKGACPSDQLLSHKTGPGGRDEGRRACPPFSALHHAPQASHNSFQGYEFADLQLSNVEAAAALRRGVSQTSAAGPGRAPPTAASLSAPPSHYALALASMAAAVAAAAAAKA